MPLDNKTLEIDLYNCFFGVPPENVNVPEKTNKDKILDNKSKKELEAQVKYMVLSIEKYIKSGTINTTVDVKIPPFAVAVGAGPTAAPNPAQIPLTGTGSGKIE